MKVTNHQKGNFTYCGSSVMYGTIEMTQKEWLCALAYLKKCYTKAKAQCDTYIRDSLSHVFNYTLPNTVSDAPVCVGVCATELLFKHYGLERYKKQNYQIVIKYTK